MKLNSNANRTRGKPPRLKKPHKDFPLSIHKGSGYWCKKVRGRVFYFGKVADDPKGQAALEQWLDQKDDLLAGHEPRAKIDALTVGDLCNRFLAHKEQQRDNHEIHPRTFWDNYNTCARIVKAFGRGRAVTNLVPDDFRKLRAILAKTRGAVALGNEVMRIRSIFKFAFDEGLILSPVRFGQAFGKPKREVIDRARQEHRMKNGERMFEAQEIRLILDALAGKEVVIGNDERVTLKRNLALRTMILLAANTGFGQTDISNLPIKAVDLDKAQVNFPRVKTAVPRRIPLWPETVAAIREYLPLRPKAKDAADVGLMFLTCRGARWVTLNATGCCGDAVGKEFSKIIKKLKLERSRRSFYALRHGLETIGGETADQIAVDLIMGHKIKGMAAIYIERVGDDRLRCVVEHVRNWLFQENKAENNNLG